MAVAVILKLCVVFLWTIYPDSTAGKVQRLDSADFDDFIAANQFCVILFKASDDCPSCVKAMEYLDQVPQPDLIPKEIQKRYVIDDDLADRFMANDYPSIVFLRRQNPILYNEKLLSSDDLTVFVEWLEIASEPVVANLYDSTFEHLTQASTGATTGDWFVFFFDPRTLDAARIFPSFESAAIHFKQRMNFAKVDVEINENLVKRFDIKKTPHIILFKHGKMYRYEPEKFDRKSFIAFIDGWYRNVQAVLVPVQPSAFDKLTESIALYIKERMDDPERRWMVLTVGALSAVGLSGILYFVFCFKGTDSRSKSD